MEHPKDGSEVANLLLQCLTIDHDVVEINDHKLVEKIVELVVDQSVKSSGSIV